MTITRVVNNKSAVMRNFVAADELDHFIDESLEMERTLSALLAATASR